MTDMSRRRPIYLHRKVTRHGKVTWYFWRGLGHARIRIRGEYGSDDFQAAYMAALSGQEPKAIARTKEPTGTLEWLIARYRESSSWCDLAPATRRQRENIFKNVLKQALGMSYVKLTRADIVATRDAKKSTPSQANNFMAAMKGLYDWAVDRDFVATNPVAGVKGVKRPRTGGYRQWTEEEIAQFESYWPIGTRERLALAILLFTGLRRGDAARLGKQHLHNGRIKIITEKTDTLVSIPASPKLLAVLAETEIRDLALLGHKLTGRPMSKEGFANWFKKAATAAGVPGNCHGLRKAAATRLAEAGATIPELNAAFGWTGSAMAMRYIEKANREMLADNAARKLENKI